MSNKTHLHDIYLNAYTYKLAEEWLTTEIENVEEEIQKIKKLVTSQKKQELYVSEPSTPKNTARESEGQYTPELDETIESFLPYSRFDLRNNKIEDLLGINYQSTFEEDKEDPEDKELHVSPSEFTLNKLLAYKQTRITQLNKIKSLQELPQLFNEKLFTTLDKIDADLDEELNVIKTEFDKLKLKFFAPENINFEDLDKSSEENDDETYMGLTFLRKRYKSIRGQQEFVKTLLKENSSPYTKETEKVSHLKTFMEVFKKIIDNIDDIWDALRGLFTRLQSNIGNGVKAAGNTVSEKAKILALVTPILTGSVGVILFLYETYESMKEAVLAIKHKDTTLQPKTKIANGFINTALGVTGLGISIALIISAAGIAIAGAALLPTLIVTFMTAIFVVRLWRNSYILHRAKEIEAEALEKYKVACDKYIELKNRKEHPGQNQRKQNNKFACYANTGVSEEALADQEAICNTLYAQYLEAKERRHEAERVVAINTLEIVAAVLILVSTVIGTAALIGAVSVATFGIAPLVIGIVGAVLAASIKIFEFINNKYDHKPSEAIRNGFLKFFTKLGLYKPEPEVLAPAAYVAQKAPDAPKNNTAQIRVAMQETAAPAATAPPMNPQVAISNDAQVINEKEIQAKLVGKAEVKEEASSSKVKINELPDNKEVKETSDEKAEIDKPSSPAMPLTEEQVKISKQNFVDSMDKNKDYGKFLEEPLVKNDPEIKATLYHYSYLFKQINLSETQKNALRATQAPSHK